MNPKDRIAVVTGGASGLGEACVRDLLKSGARIAIFDFAAGSQKFYENSVC